MQVERLTATIGAEISDVRLVDGVGLTVAADLYELLLDRLVLVFRNQALTSEAHVALGELFGPLADRTPTYPCVDGFEQIMVVRDDEQSPPENAVWHSDLSFRDVTVSVDGRKQDETWSAGDARAATARQVTRAPDQRSSDGQPYVEDRAVATTSQARRGLVEEHVA